MKKGTDYFISLLLVLVSLVWGGSFIIVKIATIEIDPVHLGFLRFLIATPIMILVLLFLKRDTYIPLKELPSLAVLGLTGVTLLYTFQFIGISYTNAPAASVLINTNVIFIAILSALFLKEKFNVKKILGVLLSFSGVLIVIFSNIRQEAFSFSNVFFIGSILVLLSAFCWAIYSIVGKRLLRIYDTFAVTTYAFTLGSIFYIPFVILDIVPLLQKISFNGWISILYLAILCSVFGYVGWYYSLKKSEASKAAVYLNLIPLFTITISIFMGKIPTIFFLFGAILIIYGVYLTQKS